MNIRNFVKALLRKKQLSSSDCKETSLHRCLSVFDLTALGIGSTLGLGIYVLAGQVASTKAGPSVVLSFSVAAVASLFAGLCYAEFGARVPKAGSAYVYSYVTVGELMAFVIGWNLILEYVIGTASVARGYSGYIDSLINNSVQNKLKELLPLHLHGISEYPDFLSLGVTLLLTLMLVIGVKESSRFNNIFVVLNLCIVLFAVIAGSFKADIHNWQLSKSEIPSTNKSYNYGDGGFFPYGFSGMMRGAATCFYAFVGFDIIATTGEEVYNPQKAIPFSIILSLLVTFLSYFGVSSVQTLMWPYWDQNRAAPLPYVFEMVEWHIAKWIISVGALAGLSASLLGAMFPLPRILYAMATDGLIFQQLATVHDRFKTPVIATVISGSFAGLMAMLFDVNELADMMSIGTLLAYTLVAVSVLLLRYKASEEYIELKSPTRSLEKSDTAPSFETYLSDSSLDHATTLNSGFVVDNGMLLSTEDYTGRQILQQIFNFNNLSKPTYLSSQVSTYLVAGIVLVVLAFHCFLVGVEDQLSSLEIQVIIPGIILALLLLIILVALWLQPSSIGNLSFQVPFVPFIPFLSIFINLYLITKLSKATWIRFAVWMCIGFIIYFGYGIRRNSNYHQPKDFQATDDSKCDDETKSGNEESPLIN
ncbi:cationic amino acid transporter 3-like isoform X2 [Limulus polyphemus]|nr:cationic amino acid transporter 3-like isoform X2 [Limulus polyphemus]XP_022251380.1 cationic amino acid transporter 3-like isoform X2 [Limulus polyphemus]XP_022251381.1 cationic amino acid transporter 3-like isoform X2 [Limulus polyphemus]